MAVTWVTAEPVAAAIPRTASPTGSLTIGAQHATSDNHPDGRFGIQLLEAPVNRRDDPRALRHIVDHLKPGSVIERRVGIANNSSEELHVKIYAGAAVIRKGEFIPKTGRARSELTEWTSVDRVALRVAPGEMAPVKATIRVPRRAVSGERYGVLLAEVVGRGEGNVKTVHRVGVRIYLSVGPGGEPRSDFEIKKITPGRTREGLPQIKAEVLNTGRRALDLGGSLTMEEVEGPLRAGPFSARMNAALAPGDTAPVVVTLDERLDDGPWRVRLTLASGRIKHTATAEVTFPPPGHWGASVIPDRYRWPLTLAGGLILAPLILITLRYRRARKRRGA